MKKLILILIILSGLFAQAPALEKTFSAMNSGDFKLALSHLQMVINSDSKNPELYRLKGMLHESLGENNNALMAWETCKKLSNNNSLILEADNHIQFLSQTK